MIKEMTENCPKQNKKQRQKDTSCLKYEEPTVEK
jgi:hypothetical protein